MTHIDYRGRQRAVDETPEDWLPALARLTEYLNRISQRTDLSTSFGTGMEGVPACFLPAIAEIRIDPAICLPGADPGAVDPSDELWRLEHPAFMGAGAHEGAHAAHTRWTVGELQSAGATAKELDVAMLLEEPRCEARMLQRLPGQRPFLRSTALEIVMRDFRLPPTAYGAAGAAALVLARRDGGTLQPSDTAAVGDKVRGILGGELLGELRELWLEFLAAGDRDLPTMLSVARRWLQLLGEDPDDEEGLLFGQPEDGDGGGEFSGEIGAAAVAADAELVEKRSAERAERAGAAAELDAERREQGERAAEQAFAGTGSAGRVGERPATDEEYRAATGLSRRLLAAESPEADKDVERSTRNRPPGRLRSRAAQQAAAYRDLGIRSRTEPFRAREIVPDARTPLTIGMMLDISGSMADAEAALSSAHWVVSHAGARVGARVAAVHFGTAVHGVARAGQIDEHVQQYAASDAWENFRDAFLTVDHELDLIDGRGARLLVVASDGFLRRADQAEFARSAMALCKQRGVHVLWLRCTSLEVSTHGHGTIVDLVDRPPVEAARRIGDAAVALLGRS